MLEFSNVSFSYSHLNESIIDSLSFKVEKGEFVSLIGPSGSGKTTIFRLLTNLEKPKDGQIHFQQQSVKIGYMPQKDMLFPWRTVLQNALLPLELQRINKREAEQLARQRLKQFGLEGTEDKYPHQLSGGMRQRVSFLRATISGANLLLLDEPFSALDAISRLSMQEWLLEQWERETGSVLFITHDVEEAIFLSDRILLLQGSPVNEVIEYRVPLKRPRNFQEMNNEGIFELKQQLIRQLRGE
ncbi:ABC transporter ATP-binding protein [Bacillus tianshenii]|nr:ABC transporter ATP-binding protein [Bacillus tianshenii]